MTRRARLIAVLTALLAGVIGIISSTQTWLDVTVTGGASDSLTVSGAAAIPVLAPLSLATMALGAALSIVGRVVRYVFGGLMLAIGVTMLILTARVAFGHPVDAVAAAVTTATGISGDAVSGLVVSIASTPWPVLTVLAWLLLLASGVFTLATAHRWRGTGRRYRTAGAHRAAREGEPLDAVDSWDDLTRGDDPTAPADPR
ncbi:Trp biosynthesis-associated membrane protein [Microbacterium sp. X-17]|uniref:Trp biosynthesis-associated membrane protein n=1 Tax=Microbacterium sp. X-17 TaxID=3144404 RepID=UPI0031F5A2E7